MKRKIGLAIILLIEATILFVFGFYNSIGSPELLKPIYDCGKGFYDVIVAGFRDLCHLNTIHHGGMIACALLNIIFIIVYFLIFGLITYFINKAKMRKIRKVVTIPYELTPQEKEMFDVDHYKKKIPLWIFISMIIPIGIIVFCLLARFDEAFSTEVGANVVGTSHFYTDFIVKYFQTGRIHTFLVKCFTNGHNFGYMDIINKIPESLYWLEYVIIALGTIIVLALWFFLFYLIYLPFRGLNAKRRSKIATRKYVYKKELKEYKYRSKHKDEYSSKSEEFMHLVEDEEEEKQSIAKNTKKGKKIKETNKPSEYYDDLGSSVRDLGVGTSEEVEMDSPFIEREVRYISDSDFDIVLENEPVIEVAEEEGTDLLSEQTKQDELFYEKYQPEEVEVKPFEEYDQSRTIVNDYVKEINEETQPEVKEEVKPVEKVKEEQNLTPLEKYRLEKKRATEERDRLLKEGTLTEENDPLAKYRKPGVRAGKVEAKVPTMAELDAERKVLHDERSKRIKEGLEKKRNAQLAAARAKARNAKHGGESKIAPQTHVVSHKEAPVRSRGEKKVVTPRNSTRVVPGERKVPPHKVK